MPREHNKFAHGFGGKEFREDTTQWMTHLCSMMPGTMVRNTQKLGDWNHVKTHSLTCLVGDVVIWDLSQGCWPGLWGYPPVSSLSASTGFLTARLSTHVSQESIEYPWHFTLLVEAVPKAHPGARRVGVDPTTQVKVFVASLFFIIFNHFIRVQFRVFVFFFQYLFIWLCQVLRCHENPSLWLLGSLFWLAGFSLVVADSWAKLPCSMWDLSSTAVDQNSIPCTESQTCNHWTTREVPVACFKTTKASVNQVIK